MYIQVFTDNFDLHIVIHFSFVIVVIWPLISLLLSAVPIFFYLFSHYPYLSLHTHNSHIQPNVLLKIPFSQGFSNLNVHFKF